jgi:integrase
MTPDRPSSKASGRSLTKLLPKAYRRPKKNAGGFTIYWYAYRGREAPILKQFDGATREDAEAAELAGFAALATAYTDNRKPRLNPSFMRALIRDFERLKLPETAPSTQKVWKGHLREIEAFFGDTSLTAMQARPDENGVCVGPTAKQVIIAWHKKQAVWDPKAKAYRHPRTANIRLTVLARVLSWAVYEQRILYNEAAEIKRLDEGPGRASITWSPEDLEAFLWHCPPPVERAVRMAALTGLRLEDVVKLTWDQVEKDVIRRPTSKSRRKQLAAIPIYPALRKLLEECRAACPQVGDGRVLVNTRRKGWKTADAFDSSMRPSIDAFRAAGGPDNHFHDLRGNAATAMFIGGVSMRQIGLVMGWTDDEVPNRLNDYVDLDAASRAMAAAAGAKA